MEEEKKERFCFLKVFTDFFSDDIIDFLMSQENGSQYVTLYLMLMMKTVNNGFTLERRIGEVIIPYDVKQIAKDSKYFDVDTVAVALELFKRLGVVYVSDDNGTLMLETRKIDVGSYSSKKDAARKRLQRANEKLGQNVPNNVPQNVTKSIRVKEYKSKRVKEEQSTEEQSTDIEHSPSVESVNYNQIVDMFHEICISLPKIKTLSDRRKKSMRSLYKQFSLADIQTVFEKAEASDFLTGRNNNKWSCNFDWLMNSNNFVKVLEGNYDNKASRKKEGLLEGWDF